MDLFFPRPSNDEPGPGRFFSDQSLARVSGCGGEPVLERTTAHHGAGRDYRTSLADRAALNQVA